MAGDVINLNGPTESVPCCLSVKLQVRGSAFYLHENALLSGFTVLS